MKEKKLTDEEVAQALLQNIAYGKAITYFDKWGKHNSIMIADIIDFIHRLQSENETQRKIIEYQDGLPDLVEQQKAEIERLETAIDIMRERACKIVSHQRRCRICDGCFLRPIQKDNAKYQAKVLHETIVEQKAEIKRLKNAYKEGFEQGKFDSQVKIVELQKQVDELKEERENMQAEIIAMDEARLQAVKDTAKEIFQELYNQFSADYINHEINNLKDWNYADFIVSFAKDRYGVEVE